MALDTEAVLDRRRLRRSASFWRAAAIVVGALALGGLGFAAGSGRQDAASGGLFGKRQIARVTIEGLITENRDQLRLLKRIAGDDHVVGVILFINSPGGTTTGGEALYEAIREVAAKKPVVAQFGTIATSAAYIAGIATDRIFARGNTITGSVGVIFQWPEVSELLGKIGVKMNEIKSGPLKAEPSPYHPADAAGRETAQKMVAEGMQWFRGLVADRRKVDTAGIPGLEQGRVFSGREALQYKLVDAIGGEREVVDYLGAQKGIGAGLRVVDWKPKREDSYGVLGMLGRAAGAAFGLSDLTERLIGDDGRVLALTQNGLVSVWQPGEK